MCDALINNNFIMEELRIYHSIWDFSDWKLNKILFLGSAFLLLGIMHLIDINNKQVPWWLLLVCILGCSVLLCILINKIKVRRPCLIIQDECIVVNDRLGQRTIRFDEVKAFECEVVRLWRFSLRTGMIVVHLVNGHGYVKSFSADGLTIKPPQLCKLLNERIKLSARVAA
jgi:hypothetical protein